MASEKVRQFFTSKKKRRKSIIRFVHRIISRLKTLAPKSILSRNSNCWSFGRDMEGIRR